MITSLCTYLPNLALEEPEEVEDQVFFFNSHLFDLCPFLLNEYILGRGKLGDISVNHRLEEAAQYLPSGFIYAPRVEVSFLSIASERFEKTEQELKAYEMPITKIIEDNSMKDLQESTDGLFMEYMFSTFK